MKIEVESGASAKDIKEALVTLLGWHVEALARENQESLWPLNQRVAVALHDAQCGANHTDGCGWYYEIKDGVHNWLGITHESWLQRADRFIMNARKIDHMSDEAILHLAKNYN